MAATNLFMSYVNTSWTPLPTGTAVTLTEVTEVEWGMEGSPESWYADGARFPRLVLVPQNTRTVTVGGGDVNKLLTVPQNAEGTFATTLQDAKNGSGTGALTFTLTPCRVVSSPHSGATGKFSTGKVTLVGYSADGSTDPLSYAIAT